MVVLSPDANLNTLDDLHVVELLLHTLELHMEVLRGKGEGHMREGRDIR